MKRKSKGQKKDKGIGIHLMKNSILMNASDGKINYIQRKIYGNDDEYIEVIDQMFANVLEHLNIKSLENLNTYLISPHHLTKHHTLLPVPNLKNLNKNKIEDALSLFVEQQQKIQLKNNTMSFSFEGLSKKNEIQGDFFSFSHIDESKIDNYLKPLLDKGLNLRYMESEENSIRRYTNRNYMTNYDDNTVYVNQFYDGKESYIGFYIFIKNLLAAVRYLPIESFSVSDLTRELNNVIHYTKNMYNGFPIHNYFIFGDDEDFLYEFQRYYNTSDFTILDEKFIPSFGVLMNSGHNIFSEIFVKKGGLV